VTYTNPVLHAYTVHRLNAKHRGIPFLLTFDEWWSIWEASGHWHERGPRGLHYVMARPNDIGGYEVGNVYIITRAENTREGRLGKPSPHVGHRAWLGRKHTQETKDKIAAARRAYWAAQL